MDVRERQVSERIADQLSLSQVTETSPDIALDLNLKGEREYVNKAVASELIAYMNKTKWLRIAFHNQRMKDSAGAFDYYLFNKCKIV
jgi:hypothetical protein